MAAIYDVAHKHKRVLDIKPFVFSLCIDCFSDVVLCNLTPTTIL